MPKDIKMNKEYTRKELEDLGFYPRGNLGSNALFYNDDIDTLIEAGPLDSDTHFDAERFRIYKILRND